MEGFDEKIVSVFNPPMSEFGRMVQVNPLWKQNSLKDFHIVLCGVGGTGGYVIRDLSRFVYSVIKRDPTYNFTITIIDPDKVEEKNLLRQNFLPQDLGLSKAEVMAARHSRAFGLQIDSIEGYEDYDLLDRLKSQNSNANLVLIGCVDNNKARRLFSDFCTRKFAAGVKSKTYWIDSGNERTSGQVILGSADIPIVTELFPEILNPERDSKSEISCAEQLMRDEQNIFVNITAASHVLNFVRMIVLNEAITTHGVCFNISGAVDKYVLMKEKPPVEEKKKPKATKKATKKSEEIYDEVAALIDSFEQEELE